MRVARQLPSSFLQERSLSKHVRQWTSQDLSRYKAKGTVADARLSYPIRAGERLTLIPTLATTWADDKHMRRYFGVTPSEAAASGLATYRPSGGFKDMSATLTASYRLSGNLNLTGSAGITHLFDKAADSPFVEQRWQPGGFVGVAYSF